MDSNKADQLLAVYSSKLPVESIYVIRDKLISCENESSVQFVMAQLKDPTISLILSICLGAYGVDRFYIGDPGIGIGKLLTCGGCGIWAIIDFFLIMDATRRKNMEALMMQLR